MATYFGSNGSVKLVTTGGSVATIGELLSWTVTTTAESIDTTSMGGTSRTVTSGLKSGSGSLSLYLDPDDVVQQDLAEGSKVDCEFYAEGSDAGDAKYSGTFLVTSVERGTTLDGLATMSAELTLDGAFTVGTV
jgi:TP901-1 family phage major tail protein